MSQRGRKTKPASAINIAAGGNDRVILTSNDTLNRDSITGFTFGVGADQVAVDLSDMPDFGAFNLPTSGATAANTNSTVTAVAFDNTAFAAGVAGSLQLLNITGINLTTAADAEAAIEAAGQRTVINGSVLNFDVSAGEDVRMLVTWHDANNT